MFESKENEKKNNIINSYFLVGVFHNIPSLAIYLFKFSHPLDLIKF